jgi:ribosomal protein S12 methylthiotransferase accessory factor
MNDPAVPQNSALLSLSASLRCVAPPHTVHRAERLMPRLGISRVTDITRLDRLGLPVFISVRPRGRALRVHAGKGVVPAEARAGALMEALEFAAAEPRPDDRSIRALSLAQMVEGFDHRFQWVDLAPTLGSKPDPERRLPALACQDIQGGGVIALPAELVFVPYEVAAPQSFFGPSSHGLASGNSLVEATLHGLLEVLERDAIAMNIARDDSFRVDGASLPTPFDALARSWSDAGIDLAVRYLPNAFGLPCFEAYLHESQSGTLHLATGSGLHPDRGIALARAICEAAQARLSLIHAGGESTSRHDTRTPLHARAFDRSRGIALGEVPDALQAERSLDGVLGSLLLRLWSLGFKSVLRHRFAGDLDGLQVVRIVVPKCAPTLSGSARLTPRLLERALGRA